MKEDLDSAIINALQLFRENTAAWSQIRNAVLQVFNPESLNTFNVQVTRSLKRLEKYGDVTKTKREHKNVVYTLSPSHVSVQLDIVYPLLHGAFNVLNEMPTYEKFKKKVLKILSEKDELDFYSSYEAFTEEWKTLQKIRSEINSMGLGDSPN